MQSETVNPADAAIAWHLRLPEMSGREWEDFISWLEQSPANREAYDLLAAGEDALTEVRADHLRIVPPAEPAGPAPVVPLRRSPRVRRAAGGIAACLALVAAWAVGPLGARMEVEHTAAGTTKELAFAGGTRIDLNGGTDLALDPANPRHARLDAGEALFFVRHGDKPFVIEAAGYTIRDLGTVFNVRLTDRTLEVSVREGTVLFDPQGAGVTVAAGERVTLDRARRLAVKGKSSNVGGWTRGELVFEDATVGEVAQAIHQRYGTSLVVEQELARRPFTGNIVLTGIASGDVAHFAQLIGAGYRREGHKWVVAEAGGAR